MSTYRFAALPSHSAVAATVTVLVSAWFTVAGVSMAFDATEPDTRVSAPSAPATTAATPDVTTRIEVTARRSQA